MKLTPHKYLLICTILFMLLSISYASSRIFRPEPIEPVSEIWRWEEASELSKKAFLCLSESFKRTIWFGTEDGLSVFRDNKWEFIATEEPVEAIYAARTGLIYYLTQSGLHLYDGEHTLLLHKTKISNTAFSSFIELENGLLCVRAANEILVVRDKTVKSCGKFKTNSFAKMPDQSLWVSRNQAAIMQLSIKEKNQRIDVSWERVVLPEPALPQCAFYLYRSQRGPLWMIPKQPSNYIWQYECETKKWSKTDTSEISPKSIISTLQTYDGSLWLLQEKRLWCYKNKAWKSFNFPDYPISTYEPRIYETRDKYFWVAGARSKVYRIDRANRQWSTYKDLSFQEETADGARWFIKNNRYPVQFIPILDRWIKFNTPAAMLTSAGILKQLNDGTICVLGGEESLEVSFYDGNTWSKQTLTSNLGVDRMASVLELENGDLLIAKQRIMGNDQGGLLTLHRDKTAITSTQIIPYKRPNGKAKCLAQTEDGNIWVGGNGLHQYINNELFPVNELNKHIGATQINSLQSQGNRLWISSWGRGVFSYRSDRGKLKDFSPETGLNTIMTDVLAIGPDDHVWVLTDEGLSRFDGNNWTQRILLSEKRFNQESARLRVLSDGTLWLTLMSDFQETGKHYTTTRYKPSTLQPETQIISFRQRIPYRGDQLIRWRGYRDNPYSRTEKLEYSYRLNNEDWSPFSSTDFIQLSNLSQKEYRLEVRARDIDFNIDPTPAKARFFTQPPLWNQPWFITTIALFFTITIALITLMILMRTRHARSLNDVKMQFYFNITHELRTPLTLIKGPIETLLQQESDDGTRQTLQMIQRNAVKLSQLIDQLLGFQKIEKKSEGLELSPGNLNEFYDEIIGSHLTLAAEQKLNVQISNSIPKSLFLFDADKLHKIINNLMSNAIKYTEEGGEIKCMAEVRKHNGSDHFLFVIEDSGTGISQKDLPRIFDRFYRNRSNKNKQEGFGIGLSYVKRLVDIYQGTIVAHSPVREINEKPCGSRFTCYIPAEQIEEATSPKQEALLTTQKKITNAKTTEKINKNILLVEDNSDMRTFLKGLLSERYNIQTATNGQEGLEIAQAEAIDLVLTDYMMPHMNGFELCLALKQDPETSHLPVIILTARQAIECQLEGLESGADAYITKPVNIRMLSSNIENILESRSKLQEKYRTTEEVSPAEITTNLADRKFLEKALGIIEDKIDDYEFAVSDFANSMHMSRMTLHRKLKAITGETTTAFIRSNRMKHAVKLFKEGHDSVSEVSLQCGFLDLSYFSRVFREYHSCTPTQYIEHIKNNTLNQLPKKKKG